MTVQSDIACFVQRVPFDFDEPSISWFPDCLRGWTLKEGIVRQSLMQNGMYACWTSCMCINWYSLHFMLETAAVAPPCKTSNAVFFFLGQNWACVYIILTQPLSAPHSRVNWPDNDTVNIIMNWTCEIKAVKLVFRCTLRRKYLSRNYFMPSRASKCLCG